MVHHAPADYICPFCLIVQGIENEHVASVQADMIYRDEAVTALISTLQWPNNPGNVIIFPNVHYENIFDLPIEYAVPIQRTARLVATTLKAVLACDGVSLRQHNEPGGSQDVWHYHVHVTPRYQGDQFYTTRPAVMPAAERESYAVRLRDFLQSLPDMR